VPGCTDARAPSVTVIRPAEKRRSVWPVALVGTGDDPAGPCLSARDVRALIHEGRAATRARSCASPARGSQASGPAWTRELFDPARDEVDPAGHPRAAGLT
jgi:hypothetical protein